MKLPPHTRPDETSSLPFSYSRKLLESILNVGSDYISVKDREGRFVYINDLDASLYNAKPQDMLGKTLEPWLGKAQFEKWYQVDMEVLNSGQKKHSEPYKRTGKDGITRWFDTVRIPFRDEQSGQALLFVIHRDITKLKEAELERKRLEEQLLQNEEIYHSIGESIDYGVWISEPDGRSIYASESFLKMLGMTQEEWHDSILEEVVHPDDLEQTNAAWKECVRTGTKWESEQRYRGVDGQWHWILSRGVPVKGKQGQILRWVGVNLDITERKKAEDHLAEQAALLDKARDAILVRNLEGKILFWNKGAERMYGWTREEAVGRNIRELIYSNPQEFFEVDERLIRLGEWQGELQLLAKSGQKITVEAYITLIRDNQGSPKSVLAISTDITEKKRLEAQFLRAQRMESIGTLAGGIAHDLNNILAPILMSIDLLKSTATDPQAGQILDAIGVSARRGADIVRQVLLFARGTEGQKIEVQPRHIVEDIASIIQDTFPKNIQLEFLIPKDTWTILGDPTQVHQVLLNLCLNARDAMPNGGNLTIGVENCVLDDQYAAMNVQIKPGRYVRINVTDSGTGVPPEILDRIFDPFFTTKELSKGTGLGLSTAMGIVKSHGGIINVYSELDKGTTFKVYLPAMDSTSETLKLPFAEVSQPRGNGETVLVVDDEASILIITSQTLQAFGYRVLTATDGADALTVYAMHQNEIALVLTDMAMPLMDGASTIQALRQINPKVRIIAVSGLQGNGDSIKMSKLGVRHFLTKPYTAGVLLRTVRTILDEV